MLCPQGYIRRGGWKVDSFKMIIFAIENDRTHC